MRKRRMGTGMGTETGMGMGESAIGRAGSVESAGTEGTEEALIRECYGRLEIWRMGCEEIHRRARESRRALLLQDPRGRGELQLHTLKSTFSNCVADQMDNMPEAVMVPENPALGAVAEDLSDVVRFILSRNGYEGLHRRRAEDCFAVGTAVTEVAWDPDMDGGKGNVALIRWPVEAFLWDPAAEDLQDGRAVFKVSLHPMSWYQARYPEKWREIAADGAEHGELGSFFAREEAGADEPRALLLEYWTRRYDPEARRYHVDCALIAGHCLLESRRDVYTHGRYPFVLDVYTPLEGLPVGEGMVQELLPMMRCINRYQAYIDMNLRMSSKGRLLVDRGAGIDKAALADWECDVIEGDRVDSSALHWLQTAPFGGLAAQQMLTLQTEMKQDSGQNQFSRGETAGGVTAASAISALQEAGGKLTRMRTAALNRGFREMTELILWLVSQFYTGERLLFITGREGLMRQVEAGRDRLFGGEGVPPLPYTVQVQVNRRNPLRVQAQNELFLQAYRMSAQAGSPIPLTALFELLQVDGKERVLPLLRKEDQLRQMLLAAAEDRQDLMERCTRAGELLRKDAIARRAMQEELEAAAAETIRTRYRHRRKAAEAKEAKEMKTDE